MCHHTSFPGNSVAVLKINAAYTLMRHLTTNVGTSVSLSLASPKSGYMVSIVAGPVYHKDSQVPAEAIIEFLRYNAVKESYCGSWLDTETELIYVDISANFEDKDLALSLAREFGEIAIWDVRNNCEIRLDYTE